MTLLLPNYVITAPPSCPVSLAQGSPQYSMVWDDHHGWVDWRHASNGLPSSADLLYIDQEIAQRRPKLEIPAS